MEKSNNYSLLFSKVLQSRLSEAPIKDSLNVKKKKKSRNYLSQIITEQYRCCKQISAIDSPLFNFF